ncbi:uncharacterized protein SAPINGB_P000590 [Magnusiomyces paraingens]|uniref:Presequence protease, mitochondrial n=1 Tax=Magnusiomyces paraingens TaxID=2606893 RepID=A0A5E8B6S4_9ASCO|nr:uncharacterized protein SAPINGB_P000590 [Saprochaete ingens]VVT44956.1 unnamed protein product [Saprochaete ingens]
MPLNSILGAGAVVRASLRPRIAARFTSSFRSSVTSKTGTPYTVGDQYGGFSVSRVAEVPQLGMTAVELLHNPTRARHLHLDRDDSNNVFSIGFKTNPPDLAGLPHILEHTTLCGSEKYPVRDPFFKMLTRSLANFMNAMTGFDYTFYPFATTNPTDFNNLQKVYLDAVYHPLLRPLDFSQEGWRLENEDANDINTPLTYKGVVYNEMKGQMSNPSYLFYIKYFREIYPSLNSSGGDPIYIPSLKYQDLKDFHDERYHPSNSFSLSYGNIKLNKILGPIEETVSSFQYLKPTLSEVKKPIELTETKSVTVDGPLDPLFDESRQHKISLSWILGDSSDVNSTYLWKIFGNLLMDGHSSPFYKALIDTNLGTDFSVNSGLDTTPARNILTIGLQGVSVENLPKFKEAVFNVFEDIAKNGIPQSKIDSILNQAELSDREVEANLGMGFVYRLFPRVFNKAEPFDLLDNAKLLTQFKEEIKNPERFQQLIKDYILDKPYFEFKMVPNEKFEANLAEIEKKNLSDRVATVTETEKQTIYETGQKLQAVQSEVEDVSVLPTLRTSDISPKARSVTITQDTTSDVPVSLRVTDTQGLTYLRMLKNVGNILPANLRHFFPLYSDAAANVGLTDLSMEDFENEIKLNTGGFSISSVIRTSPLDSSKVDLLQHFNGVSLDEKADKLYDYYSRVLTKASFGNLEKLIPLIQSSVANSMNSLSDSGHSYATTHASAAFSLSRRLSELFNGLEQVQFMKQLSLFDEKQLQEKLVPRLEQIGKLLATNGDTQVGLTFSPASAESLTQTHKKLISDFSSSLTSPISATESLSSLELLPIDKTYFNLPFQVSYVGVALKGVEYTHKDGAALQILSNLLTHKYLHKEIREKGGAYGGGASYNAIDGVFTFYSYRDPNPVNSLEAISRAGSWALANDWSERNLQEAKLSIFQSIDAPISPRSEISSQFVHGVTNELRQARRTALLNVTLDDIKQVAEKYLVSTVEADFKDTSVTVLGPEQTAFTDNNGWKIRDIDTPYIDFSSSLA